MYSVNTPNQLVYPPQPMPRYENQVRRSPALIVCGGFNVIVSTTLLVVCVWTASKKQYLSTGFVGISSAIYHILAASMAIVGGKDTVRRRSYVIASLVLGIIGCCIFAVTTIAVSGTQWGNNVHDCRWDCRSHFNNDNNQRIYGGYETTRCFSECAKSVSVLNTCIILLSFMEAVIDIVISSFTCCNMCQCCMNESSLGNVVQKPGYVIGPMQNRLGSPSPNPSAPPFNQMQQQRSLASGSQFQQTGYVVTDDRNKLI